ncbi:MAG: TolC family protein [Anaplasma sp.]
MRRGFLLLSSSLLFALSSGAYGTSLEEALTKTLRNNLAVKSHMYKSLAAKREVASASIRGFLPRIAYDFVAYENNGSSPKQGISTVVLTQPVFDGVAILSLDKAKHLHNVQDVSLALERQKVLLGAVKAYVGVLSAHEVNKLNENNVKVLEQHLLAAEKRFSVGEITKTELAQARARLSAAKSDAISAEGKLKIAKAGYARIVGEAPVDLRYPRQRPQIPESLCAAIEVAKTGNLSLALAKHMYLASKRDVAMAAARKLLPSLNISALESFKGTDVVNASHTLRVQLQFSILEHGIVILDIDRAHKAKQHMLYSMHETMREVEESIVLAWENLSMSQSVLRAARDSVKFTEIALEAIKQEAKLNLKTTLDVLDVEQELLKAKVSAVNAHSGLIVSQYNLLALIGQFNVN